MRYAAVALALAFVCLAFAPSACAESHDWHGNVDVAEDDFAAFVVTMGLGDVADFSFHSDGSARFDILVMNSTHLGIYKSLLSLGIPGTLLYLKGVSKLNTTGGDWSFRALFEDDYYFVVDNTGMPSAGAGPAGNITVSYDIDYRDNPWTLSDVARSMGVVGAAVIAVALVDHVAWKVLKLRKAEAAPFHYGTQKVQAVVSRRIILRRRK